MLLITGVSRDGSAQLEDDGLNPPPVARCFLSADILHTEGGLLACSRKELKGGHVPLLLLGTQASGGTELNHRKRQSKYTIKGKGYHQNSFLLHQKWDDNREDERKQQVLMLSARERHNKHRPTPADLRRSQLGCDPKQSRGHQTTS